ncbi:hypothetical protein GCM10023167_09480 [Brevibacterium pityocampae]|uniref:Aldose 1-epimerase n=1 Tax=Brevibacterium pityocampae TaxID=506594 RepID=A0ABP8J7X1_9MICO
MTALEWRGNGATALEWQGKAATVLDWQGNRGLEVTGERGCRNLYAAAPGALQCGFGPGTALE